MKRLLLVAAALIAAPTLADWDPGDPYKMHFPQLPDPAGWDVNATFPNILADDWLCTETGPVADVHLWGSWQQGEIGEILAFRLSIHANDPGPPSRPVDPPLWEREFLPGQWTERLYGTGDQGWYNPSNGFWERSDHLEFFQYNFVDILDPFVQFQDEVYWLDVSVILADPNATRWGWKTSIEHFMDDGVWRDVGGPWEPLHDPITQETLDLAFVITPEPAGLGLMLLGCLLLLRRR